MFARCRSAYDLGNKVEESNEATRQAVFGERKQLLGGLPAATDYAGIRGMLNLNERTTAQWTVVASLRCPLDDFPGKSAYHEANSVCPGQATEVRAHHPGGEICLL